MASSTGCCSIRCNVYVWSTLIMLLWARLLYDVHSINDPWTPQWWAEMIWWTKFSVLFSLWIDVPPLPTSILKKHHSALEVVDIWAHNETDATERFLELTSSRKYDDQIVILRNVWGKHPENKLQYMNSTENLRKYWDMDLDVQVAEFPKDQHYHNPRLTMSELLNTIADDREKLTTVTFSYELLPTQKFFNEEYRKLLRLNGIDFDKMYFQHGSHTFLYYGNKFRTRLHSASAAGFFLQVANTKIWRLIHKRYMPYVGLFRNLPNGIMKTPEYYSDDYPAGGIPTTEIVLNPGDLMYFSYYHIHEVLNKHPDRLGLAIGIRPGDIVKRVLSEPVTALSIYTAACVPQILLHGLWTSSYDRKQAGDQCSGFDGRRTGTAVYNGSTITRYDYGIVDGECVLKERRTDFQRKELMGEIKKEEWHPRIA